MTGRPGPSSVWLLCFLLHVITVSGSGRLRPIPDLPTVNFSRLGDLNLGVVLSIHRFEKEALCSNVTTDLDVLQRLESIVFAVEEINNRSNLLPNVTLGFIIVDACYKELTSLARTLHFVQTESNSSSGEEASVPSASTVAVIGTENSPLTMELAAMLSLFKIPVLSYLSSSVFLDDKSTYPYFSRTVPSDKMQATAIVDILRHFDWKYVSIVYADDSYGMGGFLAIRKRLAHFSDFCLAVTYMLNKRADSSEYEDAVKELTKPQARVVVLLMDQELATPLFRAVKRLGKSDQFTWVCSDAICTNYYSFKGVEDVVSGMICINFVSFTVERFERRFQRMTLRTGSRNPWFGEYVSALFNCSNSGPNACDKDREIRASDAYMPDFTASLPVNAVYALAHALDAVVKNCTLDKVNQCVKPRLLLDTLRSVRFEGEGGSVSFDETGNGHSSYDIRNFYIDNGLLVMKKVGEWDTATRNFSYILTKNIHWGQRLPSESASALPVSVCSRPCQAGYRAVISYPTCCFSCEACRKDERTVEKTNERNKQVLCERCATDKNFTWPDEETRKQCLPIPPTFLQITQLKGIVLLTLDVLVFAMACTVTFVYIKNGDNPLIKASSRELSIMMLAGNVFTCVLVVTFVFEPTFATCIVISVGFHLSFTLTYAPLLVKTHRIHRIFSLGHKSSAKASFLTPRAQVVIATCVISAQILIMCITMGVDPPVPQVTMPDLREKRVYKACYESQFCFIASVSFNLLLMVVCAVHGFKTRNLPASFNEARFIMFSIYSTVLLWLWFLPTYLSTTNMVWKVLCIAAALLVNVLSSLAFLFLPKLYCVYFVPKEERLSVPGLNGRGPALLH